LIDAHGDIALGLREGDFAVEFDFCGGNGFDGGATIGAGDGVYFSDWEEGIWQI
jgi:hypothetical protein